MNVFTSLIVQKIDKYLKFSQEKAINERCNEIGVYTCFMIYRNNVFKILFLNDPMLIEYDYVKVTGIKIRNRKNWERFMILDIFNTNEWTVKLDVLGNSVLNAIVNSDTVFLKSAFW